MISVNFLQTASDTRKINKSYTTLYSGVSCDLYESCDMYNPVLKVKTQYTISANYIYIPNFGRYYYISNKNFETAGYTIIYCKCDVLMSFATEILNSTQFIVRSADINNPNVKNSFVPDTKRLLKPMTITDKIQVTGKGLRQKHSYILTVLSGSTGTFATNETPAEQGEYITLDNGKVLQLVRG